MKDKGRRLDPSTSGLAGELGFTPDRFDGWLWRIGRAVYVSFIVSKQEGQGHLSALFQAIWAKGFTVKVPTPFPRMEAILRNKRFVRTIEHSEAMGGDVEVWVKRSPAAEHQVPYVTPRSVPEPDPGRRGGAA